MDAGTRVAAVAAAIVLAFVAAVAIVVMLAITDLTPCDEVTDRATQLNADNECFDGSGTRQTISLIFGWPAAVLAAASVLIALSVAVRGRGWRPLVGAVIAAVVLFVASILIGSL